jgi:acetyl-CoA acyltransferase
MTRIPMTGYNPMPNPGLHARYPQAYMSMGQTAENVAKRFQIARDAQQAFAVESHAKAAQAQTKGRYAEEIVPIAAKDATVDRDGGIRPDTNQEVLSTLPPAFDKDGTITAGTSSPLTDGASATLVCSDDFAKRNGLKFLAHVRATAVAGCAPEVMGIGPVAATKKVLARAGLELKDMDIIEMNEAFAAQVLACVKELGIDRSKLNVDGGAIALGHPLGASGARITGKAASLLKREGKRYALATLCVGGGQGMATVLEAA